MNFDEFGKFESCDVILISKRIVNPYEYNSHEKLGKLLGYLSYDKYNTLNRQLVTYDYSFIVNVNGKKIVLFNEMSQTKLNHVITLEKIKRAINNHTYGKIVDEIYLSERNISEKIEEHFN